MERLLNSDQIKIAKRGDWIRQGAFHEQVGSGRFRVPFDGTEFDTRADLNMHVLNLAICHNSGPTPIGPSLTDESWQATKLGEETACPEDYAHILTYFPDAVFCIYSVPDRGFGLRTWALRLADGGWWPAFALIVTIEETEKNTTKRTRLGTVSGVLYSNLEGMGGLAPFEA
jgi:hypothetical protein